MLRPWYSAILLILIGLPGPAEALSIYRFGGAQDLNITENLLAPLSIDPQENLAYASEKGMG